MKPLARPSAAQLIALTEQLAEPELSLEARLDLVLQMHNLLFGGEMAWEMPYK